MCDVYHPIPHEGIMDIYENAAQYQAGKDMWLSFKQHTTQLGHTYQIVRTYNIHVVIRD